MACSPGGKFLRSSLTFTPPLLSLSTAELTLAPLASVSWTVTVLLAACSETAASAAAATIRIFEIMFPSLLQRIFARFDLARQNFRRRSSPHQCAPSVPKTHAFLNVPAATPVWHPKVSAELTSFARVCF